MSETISAFLVPFVIFIGLPGVLFIYKGIKSLLTEKEIQIPTRSFKWQEPIILESKACDGRKCTSVLENVA